MAQDMACEINERYGARPFSFRFSARGRTADEMDSRELCSSKEFYINGYIQTKDEIREELGEHSILYHNMEGNGWDRVVTTWTPYKNTRPLTENMVVLHEMAEPPVFDNE